MKFLHHLFSSNKQTGFDNIQGYDDIKDIVRRALDSEDNYNLLFTGPPASAKTLFLLGILESRKGVYFDGSNTTVFTNGINRRFASSSVVFHSRHKVIKK